MQSKEVLKAAGSSCDIGSVCVYGGVSKWPQKEAKKVGVRRNYKTIMILPQTPTAELQATFKSSKKQPVKMSKCVSVCLSVTVTVCPIFLEIWNPWGKVVERSGLGSEHFSLEVV